MNEDNSENAEQSQVKFCPICGGTMSKVEFIGSFWWLCDDEECGYMEQIV
ncbi:hypothetical protein [Enterobacter asburiae]